MNITNMSFSGPETRLTFSEERRYNMEIPLQVSFPTKVWNKSSRPWRDVSFTIYARKRINFQFLLNSPKSDNIYHFPIDFEPNGIPLGSKLNEKRQIQPNC